jgi:glutamine synthetase
MTEEAVAAQADALAASGVVGVTIAWADNNGIVRSRTVPLRQLADAARRGVGITALFAVFDSHDVISYDHEGLLTPSGDVRLLPVLDQAVVLPGQPGFAWAPGRQLAADGSPWPYDQRAVLERQLEQAAQQGLRVRAGFELEFFLGEAGGEARPAHHGPAYGPLALLAVDGFARSVLTDLEAAGVPVGQLHAEYGESQLEVSLGPADPMTAADRQLLARQVIHAAARAHDLRVSFAPLVSAAGAGNGLHLHTSVTRDRSNLLDDAGTGRPRGDGESWIAGLLRDLPAIAAVTAPSVLSLRRLRPGHFAGAYQFWGVENREAPLRYVPSSELLGAGHGNVELKTVDASANPHLALAAVIAAGLAGIAEGLRLPDPVSEDPGTWDDDRRAAQGIASLPGTQPEQEAELLGCPRLVEALGDPLLGAFLAVRRADAHWAEQRSDDEVVAAHLWKY